MKIFFPYRFFIFIFLTCHFASAKAGGPFSLDENFSGYQSDFSKLQNIWEVGTNHWFLAEKSLKFSSTERGFAILDAAPSEVVSLEATVLFHKPLTKGWKAGGIAIVQDEANQWILGLYEKAENVDNASLHFADLNERLSNVWSAEAAPATKLSRGAAFNAGPLSTGGWQFDTPYRLVLEMNANGITGFVRDLDGKELSKISFDFNGPSGKPGVKFGRPALYGSGAHLSFSDVRIRTERPVLKTTPSPTGWYLQPAENPSVLPRENRWSALTSFAVVGRKPFDVVKPALAPNDINQVWLRRSFDIPADAKEKSVWISFEMIEGQAILFVNGKRIKEMLRPDWEANITDAVTPGEKAEILVYCTRNGTGIEGGQDLLMQEMISFARKKRMDSLGLTRDAKVFTRGKTAWLLKPEVVSRFTDKKLRIECEVGGAPSPGMKVTGTIRSRTNPSEKPVALPTTPVSLGPNQFTIDFNGTPWNLDAPHLYTLSLELRSSTGVLDSHDAVFGFREGRVTGRAVLLNDRTNRWRMVGPYHPSITAKMATNTAYLDFIKSMKFNVIQIQPNPGGWWGYLTAPWPNLSTYLLIDEALLTLCDELGIGVTLPIPPPANNHGFSFPFESKPEVLAQYRTEMRAYLKRYRHHPCIQAYTLTMNVIDHENGIQNISPRGMGQDLTPKSAKFEIIARVLQIGLEVVKDIDPSVPVYSHAGGAIGGEISGGNQHMNLLPLSEYEKWPSAWAATGKKPWVGDEFGCPWLGDFFFKRYDLAGTGLDPKNPEIAFTEFSSTLLGDDAYRLETENLRRKPRDGLNELESYGVVHFRAPERQSRVPAFEKMMGEYMSRVGRSWRTFGIQGFVNWILEWSDYGGGWQNPKLSDPLAGKYASVMQPLLVYLGGHPFHYLRDRNFYGGEKFTKQIVTVYDGPKASLNLTVRWSLQYDDGGVIAFGSEKIQVNAGAILFRPIQVTLPKVEMRRSAVIQLTTEGSDQSVGTTDTFHLSLWPAPEKSQILEARIVDPEGDSKKWLSPWVRDASSSSILILGRKALQKMTALPYTSADIAGGKTVVILEQLPEDLQRLGFRVEERGTRHVFIRENSHPILTGVQDGDFQDWRGLATLLPEDSLPAYWTHRNVMVGMKPQRMTRWGNHGVVASSLIELPQKGNFRPLLECEFDLAYSPLFEWRHGAGKIIFCQLDLTDRVGVDPVATEVANKILAYASQKTPALETKLSIQLSESGTKALRGLGFAEGSGPNVLSILPVSAFNEIEKEKVKSGGQTLVVADEAPGVANGFAVKELTASKVLEPIFISGGTLGPAFQRFRLPVQVNVDPRENFLSETTLGSGKQIFLGVPITAADKGAPAQARLTQLRIRTLYSRVLSFFGVQNEPALADRLTTLSEAGVFHAGRLVENLPFENIEISVPEISTTSDGTKGLVHEEVDENSLSWRDLQNQSASVDAAAYGGKVGELIDVAALFKVSPSAKARAFIRGTIRLEKDGVVNFYAGADYWAKIFVDGNLAVDLSAPTGAPRKVALIRSVPLKSGTHKIFIVLVSGSGGFNLNLVMDTLEKPRTPGDFNIDFSKAFGKPMRPLNPPGAYSLYLRPMEDHQDPYLYFFW